MFACTEAGQAILGEIRKEQEVILLTEPDKANYTITPDSKRWKTTKKTKKLHSAAFQRLQKLPKEASMMKRQQQMKAVAAFNNAFIFLELQ